MSSRLPGLYRLAVAARRRAVGEARGWIEPAVWDELAGGGLELDAADHMIENVLAKGAHRPTLRAKLFGGACVLEAFRSQDPLGAQNVRVARERLQTEHIPIVAEDTGGDHGRKLLFELQTGDAWVRAIETREP